MKEATAVYEAKETPAIYVKNTKPEVPFRFEQYDTPGVTRMRNHTASGSTRRLSPPAPTTPTENPFFAAFPHDNNDPFDLDFDNQAGGGGGFPKVCILL